MRREDGFDPISLFSMYLQITGVPCLEAERKGEPGLAGKTLGILNGSSWITLWSNYFGKKILPEVKFVNIGNEAIQLNFMQAYHEGKRCPPQKNIDLFAKYAHDLIKLVKVDAILITCSTMNRAYPIVQKVVKEYNIPVVSIDTPMMEEAINHGGKILVIATHGPTVKNTQLLLEETAQKLGGKVTYTGATVEEAFESLGQGNIKAHNEIIANAIRKAKKKEKIDVTVLAQLSMSVFKLSYPDCEKIFGMPVITSGEAGFRRIRKIFLGKDFPDNR